MPSTMYATATTSTTPSSSGLVNTQENRVLKEVNHLLSDIRRIHPEGEPYCTFGRLFTDPVVEQYYEALLGTMKAAKRRGLIQFEGQLLLKGMHDDVVISIKGGVAGTGPGSPVGVSVSNGMKAKSKVNMNGSSNTTAQQQKQPSSPARAPQDQKREAKQSTSTTQTTNNLPSLRPHHNFFNSPSKKLPQKSQKNNTNTQNNSKNTDSSKNANEDDSSIATTATAPARISRSSSSRAPSNTSINHLEQAKKSSYIAHNPSSGITFQTSSSSSFLPSSKSTSSSAKTQLQRVDREVDQLLVDIRRIQPEGSPFCSFGLLFDDPQVEQYYEALVGTLKSAKRKGLIQFQGQMLLKGMHDHVQIDIIE